MALSREGKLRNGLLFVLYKHVQFKLLNSKCILFWKENKEKKKHKLLLEKPHLECQKGKKAKGSVIAYAPHPNLQRNLASESLGPSEGRSA